MNQDCIGCHGNPCYRYDARVKAMEIDERPTEQYSDIGGLDKQIQEVWGGVVVLLPSTPLH